MSKGKTFAELRRDIIADIEAVRYGKMPATTASVIFQGVKELTSTINTEIAAAKLCMLTEGKAHEFGRVVRMGKRVIDDGDDDAEQNRSQG
jgi:hypothetical protein